MEKNKAIIKSDKKVNKAAIIYSVVIFIILLTFFIIFLIPKDNTWFSYEAFSTNLRVNNFLRQVVTEDFSNAFNNLYYYDKSTDVLTEISEGDAKQIWIDRMKNLSDKGTFLDDFKDVNVYSEDGYMRGTVVITLSEKGAPRIYETDLFFVKNEGIWKIGGISNEELKTSFESAISGYMPQ